MVAPMTPPRGRRHRCFGVPVRTTAHTLIARQPCTSGVGRGCAKTQWQPVFGSAKTPPDFKQVAYSAFYAVGIADAPFRATLLHSLGREPPDRWRFQFDALRTLSPI
jgi:hypothetical protein